MDYAKVKNISNVIAHMSVVMVEQHKAEDVDHLAAAPFTMSPSTRICG